MYTATYAKLMRVHMASTTILNLLLVSMITASALVLLPATILEPTEGGTAKLMLNISSLSSISSFCNVIFTVLLLVPAKIVTVCVVELKSVLLPNVISLHKKN